MRYFLIIFSIFSTVGYCVKIPNSIKRCSIKDSNFDECFKIATQDALSKSKTLVKEIGLAVLDPLVIPALTLQSGSGAVNFTQHYTNFQLIGISDAKCDIAKMNFDTHDLHLECDVPLLKLVFHYKFNGKLMLLPIVGEGPGTYEITHFGINLTFNLEEFDKKGKKYYKVKSTKLIAEPQLFTFNLENLFNGDKALGDNINRVLNDNWKEVYSDIKQVYENAFGQVFGSTLNRVLMKVSAEELWDEM